MTAYPIEFIDLDDEPESPIADIVRPRDISPEDRARFERNLAEIFTALGLDLNTPGTTETPRRHLQALIDSTIGYEGDPKILTAFPKVNRGDSGEALAQVVEGPIPFFALCEHHALPFFGEAWVGYVADHDLIGISKLTRLVHVVTRRFGVQEEMTQEIANQLTQMVEPQGVAVYLEAHHTCTQMRGVREVNSKTRTTAFRGSYAENTALRSEFYDIAGLRRAR